MEGPFTLIVAILSIESSYLDEVERPVKDVPDTVQFWLTSASQWRIKTYAIDHDIHVHRLGGEQSATRLSVDFAKRNIEKLTETSYRECWFSNSPILRIKRKSPKISKLTS